MLFKKFTSLYWKKSKYYWNKKCDNLLLSLKRCNHNVSVHSSIIVYNPMLIDFLCALFKKQTTFMMSICFLWTYSCGFVFIDCVIMCMYSAIVYNDTMWRNVNMRTSVPKLSQPLQKCWTSVTCILHLLSKILLVFTLAFGFYLYRHIISNTNVFCKAGLPFIHVKTLHSTVVFVRCCVFSSESHDLNAKNKLPLLTPVPEDPLFPSDVP